MKNSSMKYVGIGGTGGSGTRLVAEICKQAGVFIGDDINQSNDNLIYPNFHKLVFSTNDTKKDKSTIAQKAISKFIEQLNKQFKNHGDDYIYCGWKAPGTFFGLEYLKECLPNMSYIHVARNGFDMAFSSNQNQLNAWANLLDIDMDSTELPVAALEYWIKANQLALYNCEKYLANNFHVIYFDELCLNPEKVITKLMEFIKVDNYSLDQLVSLVKIPSTIGRHKQFNYLEIFSESQIEKVIKTHETLDSYKTTKN